MGILNELLRRVKGFSEGLSSGKYMSEIIEDNEYEIVDMNAEDQLFEKGITATGVSIWDYAPYSPVTIDYKQQKGDPADRVTLRDTGDFHDSFFVQADNEKFVIDATDWKTRDLRRLYGNDILGLTQENIQTLINDTILPALIEKAKEDLFV